MPKRVTDWRAIWESKAREPDFAASGRSSGDAGQLFALLTDTCSALQPTLNDALLDLGCGVGLLARHLRPYVHELVAVDLAVGLITRARTEVSAGRFVAADIRALPFRDGAFPKILVSSVLQYLEDDDTLAKVLLELRRVTTHGGRAFVSGNPDSRRKDKYIRGIDRLNLPEREKKVIRERNQAAYWISPDALARQARAAGWDAEIRSVSPKVWQSFYMFDLLLSAK